MVLLRFQFEKIISIIPCDMAVREDLSEIKNI